MLIYLLTYFVSSIIDVPILLSGSWNFSSAILNEDGIEIPNNNTYIYLNLYFNRDERYLCGNITKHTILEANNEFVFIQLDQLPDSNTSFSVKINTSNITKELSELTILNITTGLDNMMIATGSAKNFIYSLNISPPLSAELTTLNQNTKEVIIYRMSKKTYRRKFSFDNLIPFITTFAFTVIKFLFQ